MNRISFLVDKDFTEIKAVRTVFTAALILLCVFHVIKTWKETLDTARYVTSEKAVSLDDKEEILAAFKRVMYAPTPELNEIAANNFVNRLSEVLVRLGSRDQDKFQPATGYYFKHWEAYAPQWMFIHRRTIPGMETENTNNRLERLWRSMKDNLSLLLVGPKTMPNVVSHLVHFCDSRLESSYLWDQRHKMRLYDSNDKISREYARGADDLNDRGMLKFKEGVEALKKRRNQLREDWRDGETVVVETTKKTTRPVLESHDLDQDGFEVEDEMGLSSLPISPSPGQSESVEIKTYKTSETSCNCSWRVRNLAPCRHVLFLREALGLGFYDAACFHERYLKIRNIDLLVKDEQGVSGREEPMDIVECDSDGEPASKSLTENQRFGLLAPVAQRFVEAMVKCGTNKVHQYRDEIEILIQRAKSGESLLGERVSNAEKSEQPVREASKEKMIVQELKRKYSLKWYSRSKFGKIGRPKKSKVRFSSKKKSSKDGITHKEMNEDSTPSCELPAAPPSSKVKAESAMSASTSPAPPPTPVPAPSGETIVCSYPPDISRPNRNVIFLKDIRCLRPAAFINDIVVDLEVRRIFESSNSDAVLMFTAQHAPFLRSYWSHQFLNHKIQEARLHSPDGKKFILVPWAEAGHWFLLVGVIGDLYDSIYVLESIGGYDTPSGAQVLKTLMESSRLRNSPSDTFAEVVIVHLSVPKQATASNDCAIFMLHNMKMIYQNPEDFIGRVLTNNLGDWYKSGDLAGKRREILEFLRSQAAAQRIQGEVHANSGPFNLPAILEPSTATPSVKILQPIDVMLAPALWPNKKGEKKKGLKSEAKKERTCRLCRQSGHDKRRCPMRK